MTHTMTRRQAFEFLQNDSAQYGWFEAGMTKTEFFKFVDEVEFQWNENGAAEQTGSTDRPYFGYIPDQTRARWYRAMTNAPAPKQLRYTDIKTADQLRTRIRLDSSGYKCLDCGNQYHHIRPLLARDGDLENLVFVTYTAGSGSHLIARYIA